jgi:tRNA-specific 2-thiouridylase
MLSLERKSKNSRVVVAMSGGVDSATAAALMVESGYDVVGITLRLYEHGVATAKTSTCCAGKDIYDARRVAEKLEIPHYVLDYEKRFKEKVIDDFADSYTRGETPIPCIKCNQNIKFSDLLDMARDLDAGALVTGHYVQRINGRSGPELHRGYDNLKDQSYFLFATTKKQLDFLHFPLGGMAKDETRAHARRLGVPIARKPESQDICFVPSGSYSNLINQIRPEAKKPGNIVDVLGNTLGTHQRIIGFTVGQRRGLGISTGEPQYVLKIRLDSNEVVIGPKSALLKNSFMVDEINWLGEGNKPTNGMNVEVKIRSASEPVDAKIVELDTGGIEVSPKDPISSVAPGQACVFYQGRRVLGGGWISRG